ncbi:MAG: hypothetical protein OEY23_02120 [Acidimicrobiia bacterium]|nr:hypothetical protein [Acidimicrobiia bacterium]
MTTTSLVVVLFGAAVGVGVLGLVVKALRWLLILAVVLAAVGIATGYLG